MILLLMMWKWLLKHVIEKMMLQNLVTEIYSCQYEIRTLVIRASELMIVQITAMCLL